MLRQVSIIALMGGLATGALADEYRVDGVPESDQPIVIAMHNWSSQLVVSHVTGELLEKLGYSVEYVPSDSQVVYTAIGQGDIHVQMEVWEGAFKTSFEAAMNEGGVIDAGDHDAVTREEWWYPLYVEELCPGLPDWEALNACAETFATPETAPKGRFLAGPVDWLKHDHERVEALGVDFEVINAGSAAALWAELASASSRNEPIVLFNWTPNFIEAVYEGRFIEFPEYDPACHSDPAWGTNPDEIYDCGNPADGYLKKAAWAEMPDTWPTAYALIQQITLTNADIAKMAALVDVEGMEPEEAAQQWLDDNQETWQAWMKAAGA